VAAAHPHAHRPGHPGALTHPEMVEALGHNVPRVFMLVFGSGCALAGLAA
jgi:branched-subunit amino acid ABC-type transport system permease component